ncbi:MAG TPA: hypothetical protein VFV17_07595 [Usitatibacteraceae bacterium]|nr:hypothetical protein [Usitatibacteraceae bacterium]
MITRIVATVHWLAGALASRTGITLGCLLMAATFYAIGWNRGAVVALVIGSAFELAFWVRLAQLYGPPSVRAKEIQTR